MNVSKKELVRAEGKWEAVGATTYSYSFFVATLARSHECDGPNGGIEVIVVNNETTSFGTCSLDSDDAREFGSIEAIFSTIYGIKSEGVPGLEVTFNEVYGFPEAIDVNYSRWLTDHRVQYYVRNFSVRQ